MTVLARLGALAVVVDASGCCAPPGRRGRSAPGSRAPGRNPCSTVASARTRPGPRLRSSISSTARATRSSVARRSFLGGLRRRGRAGRRAGARQHVAAAVDDGDVLRPQARHRRGDQVQDRLHALAVHAAPAPAMVSSTEACASCRSRANGSRRGSTRCTRTARTPAMPRMVRASSPSSARVWLSLLLELAGGEAVAAVEDFVADGAAGRQPVLGQQQAQPRRPGRPAP